MKATLSRLKQPVDFDLSHKELITQHAKAAAGFSRRSFIRRTTAAACVAVVVPQIIPSSVLGRGGKTAPSNRLAVGFIDTGDHGVNWNLHPDLRHKDAQVVAACDVDRKRLLCAQETINDHYKNENGFTTRDFRVILARKDIAAVMISTCATNHSHSFARRQCSLCE